MCIIHITATNMISEHLFSDMQPEDPMASMNTMSSVSEEEPPFLGRSISLDVLANDFLIFPNEHGATLEARLYLVERVFPSLITAMEQLLMNLQRKKWSSTASPVLQLDHLPVHFNPILWLAHYLFRHPPTPHRYLVHLNEVAQSLQHRLAALQTLRISQLKAEKQGRKLAYENQCILNSLRLEKLRHEIRERSERILRKLPHVLQINHAVQLTDFLTSSNAILTSSFFAKSPEKQDAVQKLHEGVLETCQGLDLTQVPQDLSTLDVIVQRMMAWTEDEHEHLFQAYDTWLTSEEEKMATSEVEIFVKQWEATGLSLGDALKFSLVASEAFLPEPLVEEIQAVVHEKEEDRARLMAMFQKMATTHLKSVAVLYSTFMANPEYKVHFQKQHDASAKMPSHQVPTLPPLPPLSPSPVETADTARKEQIQSLVQQWIHEWKEHALTGHHINRVLGMTAHNLLNTPELSDHVRQTKLSIPLQAYETHTVPNAETLVDHLWKKWKSLSESDFTIVMNAFRNASSARTQEIKLLKHTVPLPAVKKEGKNEKMEMEEKETEKEKPPLLSTDYGTVCLNTLTPLLEKLPSNVRIHIAFQDESILEEQGFSPFFHPGSGRGMDGEGYTVISSTDSKAVGMHLHGNVFESLQTQPSLVMESKPGYMQAWHSGEAMGGKLGFAMVVPIVTSAGKVGVIYLDALQHVALTKTCTTTSDVQVLLEAHQQALMKASEELSETLEVIHRLHSMVVIAESSIPFLREQAQADPRFYLVEKGLIYAVAMDDTKASSFSSSLELWKTVSGKHMLCLLEATPATDFIYQCASTQSNMNNGEQTAVPILDQFGQTLAVMVLSSLTSSEPLPKEDLEEVNKIAKILGTALSTTSKKKAARRLGLATDSLESQGEMIFATFMLDSIRESIRELDSSAIAELKSYKKPPPTIHKVLKCYCYLFGKTPKQVKLWSDTIKYISMDMLKQMLNYDPTSIQRKSVFIRIRKVLKTIPHGDVRKKGSLPALTVYAWLLVNMELRDKAIQARRRASIKEGKPPDAEEEEVVGEEEPLDAEDDA